MEQREHQEAHGHVETHAMSIWFFIGIVLVVYGALILGAGIYGLFIPPTHQVVLAKLHAGVWWGGLMLIFGIIYVVKFFPKKGQN